MVETPKALAARPWLEVRQIFTKDEDAGGGVVLILVEEGADDPASQSWLMRLSGRDAMELANALSNAALKVAGVRPPDPTRWN